MPSNYFIKSPSSWIPSAQFEINQLFTDQNSADDSIITICYLTSDNVRIHQPCSTYTWTWPPGQDHRVEERVYISTQVLLCLSKPTQLKCSLPKEPAQLSLSQNNLPASLWLQFSSWRSITLQLHWMQECLFQTNSGEKKVFSCIQWSCIIGNDFASKTGWTTVSIVYIGGIHREGQNTWVKRRISTSVALQGGIQAGTLKAKLSILEHLSCTYYTVIYNYTDIPPNCNACRQ